jgi:Tol biopolymer transport system component
MNIRRRMFGLALFSLLAWSCAAGDQRAGVRLTPFNIPVKAGQVSWSPDGKRLAYAAKDKKGFFQIHTVDIDGKNDINLTEGKPGIPGKHAGGPNWHPGGKYILYVAEKDKHPGISYESIPGFGGYSDVWVMNADGSKYWQLTDTPNKPEGGILIPRFSADGKKVCWAERVEPANFFDPRKSFACWVIKVADFVETETGPQLKNTKTFEPGARGFYESYGFTPDGKRVIFCSNMNQPSVWTSQIFTMDAETGKDVKRLTEKDYNEHAVYSPDGRFIVWMTTTQSGTIGCDWWVMKPDGSGKRRLSYLNMPGHKQFANQAVWAGLVTFSPDGKRFIGEYQINLVTQEGKVMMAEFVDEDPTEPAADKKKH